jgi:DNA-binding transcriptional LysR family regulator
VNESELRRFLEIVEVGSIRTAARRMVRSATNLSRDMDRLEQEVSVPLFVRGSNGVSLTEAGEIFRVEAEAVLAQMEAARAKARRAADGQGPLLRIGHGGGASYDLLPAAVTLVHRVFPNLRFSIREVMTATSVAALLADELDVALVRPPVTDMGLREQELVRESFVVALPCDHRLARQPRVSLADLKGERFVSFDRSLSPGLHGRIGDVYLRAGLDSDLEISAHVVDQASNLLVIVASGVGVGVLTSGMAAHLGLRSDVVVRDLDPVPLAVPLSVAWRDRNPSLYVAEMVKDLEAVAADRSEK